MGKSGKDTALTMWNGHPVASQTGKFGAELRWGRVIRDVEKAATGARYRLVGVNAGDQRWIFGENAGAILGAEPKGGCCQLVIRLANVRRSGKRKARLV